MESERNSTDDRLTALEVRVADVEARLSPRSAPQPSSAAPVDSAERFWVLNGLREHLGDADGGVIYAGILGTPAGPIEWQYAHTSDQLLAPEEGEADVVADRLAALGSPIRLRLLREVLNGVSSVPELAALDSMGTTGQVYHHVRILTTAGWLRSARRGFLQVPPERVVPLMLAVAATR